MPQRINPREFSPRARRRPGPLIPPTALAAGESVHNCEVEYVSYTPPVRPRRTERLPESDVFGESPWDIAGLGSLTVDGATATYTTGINIEPPRERTEIEKRYDELRAKKLVAGALYMTNSGVVMRCVGPDCLLVVFAPADLPDIEVTANWFSETLMGCRFLVGSVWHYIGYNSNLQVSPEQALEAHMNIAKQIEP